MLTTDYSEVIERVQRMSPDDQLRLIEELTVFIRRQVLPQSKHSILELQGLGKKIWQDMDAQEYVDQERASWNG